MNKTEYLIEKYLGEESEDLDEGITGSAMKLNPITGPGAMVATAAKKRLQLRKLKKQLAKCETPKCKENVKKKMEKLQGSKAKGKK